MEIMMNMVQAAVPETAPAVMPGNAPSTGQIPDGAFALFFAQMIAGTESVPSPAAGLFSMPQDVKAGEEQGDALPKDSEPAEVTVQPAALPADLQAALVMQQMMQPLNPVPMQMVVNEPREMETIDAIPAASPLGQPVPEESAVPVGDGQGTKVLPQVATEKDIPVPKPLREGAMPEQARSPETLREITPSAQSAVARAQTAEAAPVEVSPMPKAEHAVSPGQAQADVKPVLMEASQPTQEEAASVEKTAVAGTEAVKEASVEMRPRAERAVPIKADLTQKAQAPQESAVHEAKQGEGIEQQAAKVEHTEKQQSGFQQEEQPTPEKGKEAHHTVAFSHLDAGKTPEAPRGVQAVSAPAEQAALPEQEHILAQVREKLTAQAVAGKGEVSFTLHPEQLGELKIMVRMEDQRLKVEIVAQNQNVRDALMQNVDGLRDSLSRQNITVDRFDVSTGSGRFSDSFQEGRQAHRDHHSQPAYLRHAGKTAESEERVAAVWKAPEDSLVDVHF